MAIRAHGGLASKDDQWFIAACREEERVVQLDNVRTGHSVELGADNIYEYRSPDFLVLKCQIYINDNRVGPGVEIEPLADPRR